MSSTIHVNVNGNWKYATNFYVNVNGTWKTGTEFLANISNVWKGGAPPVSVGLPSTATILSLNLVDFSLPTFGIIDAKATVNSQTLNLVDFSIPSFGMDT